MMCLNGNDLWRWDSGWSKPTERSISYLQIILWTQIKWKATAEYMHSQCEAVSILCIYASYKLATSNLTPFSSYHTFVFHTQFFYLFVARRALMATSDEAESSGEPPPKCTLKDTSVGALFYHYAYIPNLTLSVTLCWLSQSLQMIICSTNYVPTAMSPPTHHHLTMNIDITSNTIR